MKAQSLNTSSFSQVKKQTSGHFCYSSFNNLKQKTDFQYFKNLPWEIHEVVQNLAKLNHIHQVRAVALRSPDLHWIDFELEAQQDILFSSELWNTIEDLVIKFEWKLRDKTQENWYFDAKIFKELNPIKGANKILSASYLKSKINETKINFSPRSVFKHDLIA